MNDRSPKSVVPGAAHVASRWTMFFYGIGRHATGAKNAAFNTFILFYYQQVVGISGTLTGIALAIAMVADAISDPVVGVYSDRFNSLWGRRHGFMFASVLPLAISFIALFNPPEGMTEFSNFAWLTVFAVMVRVSITLFDIPHLALGAELATDYVQRTALFSQSAFFAFAGSGAVILMGYVVFFPTTEQFNPGMLNAGGYFPFSLFFAAFMAVYIIASAWGTLDQVRFLQPARRKADMHWRSTFGEVREVLRNRSFRSLFAAMLLTTLIGAIESVFQPFMGFNFWELTTEQLALAFFIGPSISIPLSVWLVPKLTERYEKSTVLIGAFIVALVSVNWAIIARLADLSWFPENGSPWVLVIVAVNAFFMTLCMPAVYASQDSMLADIADEIDLETAHRQEGILYSSRTFVVKATSAFGLIIGGFVLDLIDFPRNAAAGTVDPDTVWQLGFFYGPVTSSIMLIGVMLFFKYSLTRNRVAEIQEQLGRRANSLANKAST